MGYAEFMMDGYAVTIQNYWLTGNFIKGSGQGNAKISICCLAVRDILKKYVSSTRVSELQHHLLYLEDFVQTIYDQTLVGQPCLWVSIVLLVECKNQKPTVNDHMIFGGQPHTCCVAILNSRSASYEQCKGYYAQM